VPCSSLGTSRWLTKEELEALLVETISAHDVRGTPSCFLSFICLNVGDEPEVFVQELSCV